MALFHIRGIGLPSRKCQILCRTCLVAIVIYIFYMSFLLPSDNKATSYREAKRNASSLHIVKATSKIVNKSRTAKPSNHSGEVSDALSEHDVSRFTQLTAKFPWIVRRKYLENYFTRRKVSDDEGDVYEKSKIVFLHHNKAAGTTVKTCLTTVAGRNSMRIGPVMASTMRVGIHTSKVHKKRYQNIRVFMGGYSFGICDEVESDEPCSYFTFLRNPYERVISSFEYCKRARSDQLCSVLNANEVTIEEWAKHQGSFFYRQVLFKPEFCMKDFNSRIKLHASSETHDQKWNKNVMAVSCWFREKLGLKNITTNTERDLMLNYILDNMETWFAVIGIVEEYEVSMELMEAVYKLPFTKFCGGLIKNYHLYKNSTDDKSSNSMESMKTQLMKDQTVKDSLYYDLRIYEKATEIFEKQKKIFMQQKKMNLRIHHV
ncbi:uncharacterized protein [Ptychodera flava]|uniref:uncharacterized protein n=1 Tax=Ptychodera flava TaxID=63121 RepID=UPI00396A867B